MLHYTALQCRLKVYILRSQQTKCANYFHKQFFSPNNSKKTWIEFPLSFCWCFFFSIFCTLITFFWSLNLNYNWFWILNGLTILQEKKNHSRFTNTDIRDPSDSTTQTLSMMSSLTVSNRYIWHLESLLDWSVIGWLLFDSNRHTNWCRSFALPCALKCPANDSQTLTASWLIYSFYPANLEFSMEMD